MKSQQIKAKGKIYTIKDRNSFTKFMREVIGIKRSFKSGYDMSQGYETKPPVNGASAIIINGPALYNKNYGLEMSRMVNLVTKLCAKCDLEYTVQGSTFNIKF